MKISSTLESMPDVVVENVLSYLGPTYGIACASKTLHFAHERIVAQMGIVFTATVDRNMWRTDKLPPLGAEVSKEQGFALQKLATLKVRAIWGQISEKEKIQFKGYTLSQISISASFFRMLIRIDLTMLQRLVPDSTGGPEDVSSEEFFKRMDSEVVVHPINQAEYIPDSIGCLTNLKVLGLIEMHLKKLPPSIGQLKALESLFVFKNELETLPPEIGSNMALKSLYFGHNKIATLPESIGRLASLKVISAHNNNITIIPESFKGLISLEEADFSDNFIQKCPYPLVSLPSLRNLHLRNNPFQPEQKFIDLLNTSRAKGCLLHYDLPSPSGLKRLWSKIASFAKRMMRFGR